ncbi:hypothetical protein FPZ42_01080 [Mucilaginibacter achroorhodeus]|uniref:Uncharacterized protein n=1 Tax=Mucilaginibacter achroorhodeus TaxID=2599294 RepID=A0A563U910_9SPHI|nr:hypothetical protein [Mucilaginibacter achroorhodeus]TWR27835.1 hypothetical protein FPZ42_01080 [Mucilaginibacter achroorhodeus]
MTDSVCNCLTRVDLQTVKGKADATAIFTNCFVKHANLLFEVAEEKHVDTGDKAGMRQIGIDIGKNLFRQNCQAFSEISIKMASKELEERDDDADISNKSIGTFKRIDNKGFNYVVILSGGKEKSFLWFGQFQGYDKFTGPITGLVGKKLKICWKQTEAYLPGAKGYFQLKEITAIEILK